MTNTETAGGGIGSFLASRHARALDIAVSGAMASRREEVAFSVQAPGRLHGSTAIAALRFGWAEWRENVDGVPVFQVTEEGAKQAHVVRATSMLMEALSGHAGDRGRKEAALEALRAFGDRFDLPLAWPTLLLSRSRAFTAGEWAALGEYLLAVDDARLSAARQLEARGLVTAKYLPEHGGVVRLTREGERARREEAVRVQMCERVHAVLVAGGVPGLRAVLEQAIEEVCRPRRK